MFVRLLHGAQRGAALITRYQGQRPKQNSSDITAETKEKLDRLRAKQAGHRGVCTKLTEETDELIHQTEADYGRCEIVRSLLDEKSKILKNINEEILGICEVGKIESEIEESTEITSRIL